MEIKEKLMGLLSNPFEGLENNNASEFQFQNKCKKIAEELLKNYCIHCGEKTYYLAEIEFYYRDKDIAKWDNEWNKVTYSNRNGFEAGSLFYHLSGVDICFDCTANRYGGILIRSIVEKNNNDEIITIGPLTCVNKMLNDCKGDKMPFVDKTKLVRSIEICSTYRYLGKKDFNKIGSSDNNKDENLMLAFFDKKLEEAKWNKARSSYYKERLLKHIDKNKLC